MSRKIGVGFNRLRVLGEGNGRDVAAEWRWARRMARMILGKRWMWARPWGASAVEARRSMIREMRDL